MKFIGILTLITVAVLISGCDKKDDKNEAASGNRGSEDSSLIIGTWKDPSTGRINIYKTDTYTSQFVKTYDNLGYKFDATSYWSYAEKGTKRVQPNDRNVTKIDIERTSCKVYITPTTSQATSDFNNVSKCTFTDWSINTKKDISSCTDALVQAHCVASSSKNIYFIEDNKLYFGYAQSHDADGYSDVLRLDYMERQ